MALLRSFPILICIFTSLLFSQTTKIKVALYDLQPKGVNNPQAMLISDRIRSELGEIGAFQLVERNEIEKVLKKQKFKKKCASDDKSCLVKVGQLVGVDYMIAGTISRSEELFTLTLRMINIATSKILCTVTEDVEGGMNELTSVAIGKVLKKLTKEAGGEITETVAVSETGDLRIDTEESGASIEIDGKDIDKKTPVTLKEFPAGDHRIVVKNGALYGSKTILLKADELLEVTIPMRKEQGTLEVLSKPTGARVIIDGVKYEVTPFKKDDVPIGEHHVQVKKKGYFTKESIVQIDTAEVETLSFKLEQAATITVITFPKRATICINGKRVGKGTVKLYEVPAGKVSVEIEASGYDPFRKTYKVAAGKSEVVEERLTSVFATLEINSKPGNAYLFLNEEKVGSTPYLNDKLNPGTYKLKLQFHTYEDIKEDIKLAKNGTFKKEYVLQHTKAYADSLKKARRKRIKEALTRHGGRNLRRIIFGGLAAICGAAGYYYNWEAGKDNDFSESEYDAYKKATVQSDINRHKAASIQAREDAEENISRRNLAYGVAGVFAAGLLISIPF